MPVAIMQDSFEGRYTLPIIETVEDTAEEIRRKQERVRALCTERNAVCSRTTISGRRCRK